MPSPLNRAALLTQHAYPQVHVWSGEVDRLPGRVQLSIICTKFLDTDAIVDFWVAQLLISIRRWCSRSPSQRLQAVMLFDEADQYLPAGNRQPATKQPMEDLLKRARSAGVSIFLGTQSPGDLDYRCKENIRNWFIGNVKQERALEKLKAVLNGKNAQAIQRLALQKAGEFHLAYESEVWPLYSQESLIQTLQLPEDQIIQLARQGRR